MTRHICVRIFLFVAVLRGTLALPNGPPLVTCESMNPIGHLVDSQDLGYSISTNVESFTRGSKVEVTVSGPSMYRGLFLQVRQGRTGRMAMGRWDQPSAGFKLISCPLLDDNAIGHSDRTDKGPSVTFTWNAPDDCTIGEIYVVRATVVRTFSNVQEGITREMTCLEAPSPPIPSSGPPQPPPDTPPPIPGIPGPDASAGPQSPPPVPVATTEQPETPSEAPQPPPIPVETTEQPETPSEAPQPPPIPVETTEQPETPSEAPQPPPIPVETTEQPETPSEVPQPPPIPVETTEQPETPSEAPQPPPIPVGTTEQPETPSEAPQPPPVPVTTTEQPETPSKAPQPPPIPVATIQQPVPMTIIETFTLPSTKPPQPGNQFCPNSQYNTIPQGMYDTDFEDDSNHMKGWKNVGTTNWLRKKGSTFSLFTGPLQAYEGKYYIYLEASNPTQPQQRAVLESGDIRGCYCLHFYLNFMVSNRNHKFMVMIGNDVVFEMSSSAPNSDWINKSLQINTSEMKKIRLVAERGDDWIGDTGLDNISLVEGLC